MPAAAHEFKSIQMKYPNETGVLRLRECASNIFWDDCESWKTGLAFGLLPQAWFLKIYSSTLKYHTVGGHNNMYRL